MTDLSSQSLPTPAGTGLLPRQRPHELKRLAVSWLFWGFVVGNGVAVLAIWGHGGESGLDFSNFGYSLQEIGRITALLSGYLVLIEVILLARLPFVERLVGFDRLTHWHRWNGHAVIYLVLVHVVTTVWGYARIDGTSWFQEYWNWLTLPQTSTSPPKIKPHCFSLTGCTLPTTSPFPGIITATVGTFLLVVVLVTSLVIIKRRLSYEWWYAVHFTAYAGIALAWFHFIPDGNDLHLDVDAADYFRALYVLTLALVLYYRLARPIWHSYRHALRVTEVVEEGPGIYSLRIGGRDLDKFGARSGQFFFWRFFTKGFWYTQLPFSLSEAPDGRSFRITIKNLGDHTAKIGEIPVGTRVFVEGPFGVFTDEARTTNKSLLIAGGIGITPVRALLENMGGDLVALYRVVSSDDVVFSSELDAIAERRGARVDYVVGDHATPEGRELLSPRHLKELVPDIAERDVYICGPIGMVDNIIPNLRRADVPRRHLHVERFAL